MLIQKQTHVRVLPLKHKKQLLSLSCCISIIHLGDSLHLRFIDLLQQAHWSTLLLWLLYFRRFAPLNHSEPDVRCSLPEHTLTNSHVEHTAHHVQVDHSEMDYCKAWIIFSKDVLSKIVAHCPHRTEHVQDSLQEASDGDPHLTSDPWTGQGLPICSHTTHVFAQVGYSRTTRHHHNT